MADTDLAAQFGDKSIKDQLEILKLVKQHLDIQSQVLKRVGKVKTASDWNDSTTIEQWLGSVVFYTSRGAAGAEKYHRGIQATIRDLEEQVQERDTIGELAKGCDKLNELVNKVISTSRPKAIAVTGTKRSRKEYEELEDRALKVFRTCKKLKGTKREW